INPELVEDRTDERCLPLDAVTSIWRRSAAVADQVYPDHSVCCCKPRCDVIPPVDCCAEPVNENNCRAIAFASNIGCYDAGVDDGTAVARQGGAGLPIHNECIGNETDGGDDRDRRQPGPRFPPSCAPSHPSSYPAKISRI